jgi:hypothetical protein
VNAALTRGSVVVRVWKWKNWCRGSGRFTFFARPASNPAQSTWSESFSPPNCEAQTAASKLTRFALRLSPCAANNLRLRTGGGQGYRGWILDDVRIGLSSASPCRLRTRVTFAVQERSGAAWTTPQQIRGDPGQETIGTVLTPHHPVVLVWGWFNWCGGNAQFRALGDANGRTTTSPLSQPPFCQSPASPSTLKRFFNPPYPAPPS